MPNNPLPDAALAELDRLHKTAIPLTFANAAGHIFNAYPALRQRLLDAESRLADVEREIEFLRSAGEAEVNFWVNVIRSLDTENLCDFFDGAGAKEELQRWLAARYAQQRREGAIEAYERAADMLSVFSGEADAEEMMRDAAKRLREGK